MALDIDQLMILRQAGFTDKECERLNQDLVSKPQPINLEAPEWKTVIDKRKAYMDYKTREVATRNRVSLQAAYAAVQKYINAAYEKLSGLSPWVFLRSEYQKSRGYKTDYMKALKARERAQTLTKQVYKV